MFFMIGAMPQRKEFDYNSGVMICGRCGTYGRYRVYMTCMCLSLFFIPFFKWNRQYFAESTCCGATYELDPTIGRRIARGENVEILPQHLRETCAGYGGGYESGRYGNGGYGGRYDRDEYDNGGYGSDSYDRARRCPSCGYTTNEDFIFCPKCGRRF